MLHGPVQIDRRARFFDFLRIPRKITGIAAYLPPEALMGQRGPR